MGGGSLGRNLCPPALNSLGLTLGLGEVSARGAYAALDWLGIAQCSIEDALARRHLHDGTLVLYDVSSSYVEGRCCELAQFGHPRDHRPDKMQIVYGLLCSADGYPVAIEVFEGNTGDLSTVGHQISKLKERFDLKRVVMVGDRGMITDARIEEDLKPAGFEDHRAESPVDPKTCRRRRPLATVVFRRARSRRD